MQTVVGLVVCLAAGPGAVLPRNAECKLGRLARKRTLYDLIIQNTTLAPIRRECGGSLCSALLRVLVDVRAWHLHLSRLHHSEATVRSHGHQTHHGRAPNWPNPPWQPSWPRWLWLAAGMNTGEKGKNMQKRWVTLRMMPWPQKRGLAPLCCARVHDESGEWPRCLGVLIKSAAIPNFSPVHNLIASDWNVPVLAPTAGPAHCEVHWSSQPRLIWAPSKEARVQYPAGSLTTVLFHQFTPSVKASPLCHASCKLWILGNCNEGLISAPCAHSQTVHSEIFTLHNPHIRPQLSRARVWTSRDEIS